MIDKHIAIALCILVASWFASDLYTKHDIANSEPKAPWTLQTYAHPKCHYRDMTTANNTIVHGLYCGDE